MKRLLSAAALIVVTLWSGWPIPCLAAPACLQENAEKAAPDPPPISFVADLALLQPKTREDHEKADLRGACFAHYQSQGRELVFIGTQHGTRLDSPSHQLIEQVIDGFQPDCIVIEGSETRMGRSHPGLLRDARRMVSRGSCPEPLFTAALAAERKIEFVGGEPPPKATTEALRKLGTDRDALGWLLVRQLGQVRREEGLERLDARLQEMLPRLKRRFQLDTDMSLTDFKAWFHQRAGHPFSAKNLRFARTAPLDGPTPTFFEKAAIEVMLARERHLLSLQAELLTRHRRVMVVYGNGHLVYETPVLAAMLGKPTRIDRRW
ncbi:MAG: hypothetical protein MK108_10090 [Mariniblastus sp.]|nr:hypothetical protein [Mariniblastus sp.]